MSTKVSIIGKGNVGSALERGLKARDEYEVRSVGNEPDKVREFGSWGDCIILAVPYGSLDAALTSLDGTVDGKVVVDVTNVLTPDMKLALGFTTSGAEVLQSKLPTAQVVKAFNTVFAQNMATGKVKGQQLSLFAVSDHPAAMEGVLEMGRSLGFDPVNAGPLRNARWLETLGFLNIQLGYSLKMGRDIGFKLVH
jgi:predicted dinucleotide-binding enzyme